MMGINDLGSSGRSPSEPGSSPSGQAPTGLAGSAATIPSAVYVIIGSSGEYVDRWERVIGFVLTEDDARKAVERAEHELGLPDPIPYPYESTHGYQRADGSWSDSHYWNHEDDAVWREKPNSEEIKARQEVARDAWRKARVDAGRIDADGSMDIYYYEKASFLAQAIEAQSGETGTGSIGEAGESAVANGDAPSTDPDSEHHRSSEG